MSVKIKNRDLAFLPLKKNNLLIAASRLGNKLIKVSGLSKDESILKIKDVLRNPELFLEGDTEEFASLLSEPSIQNLINQQSNPIELRSSTIKYANFGGNEVEEGAIKQMETSLKLPISIAGALMPDAHQGYGLPIGGVLATEADKIIPYAVGVDIACRMCLSIYDLPELNLSENTAKFQRELLANTVFGAGGAFPDPMEDDVFDHPDWNSFSFINNLKSKAVHQVGSSGTGNHFVEWGIVEIKPAFLNGNSNEEDILPPGRYVALLSHSGSRAFGASIADKYSEIAKKKCNLPKEAVHLSWLDLNTQEGQEYWIGMNLAGLYASANHHQIHKRISTAMGLTPIFRIENHHNFAWKEKLADGTEVMVHRKGATPAGKGELGIIPGSCAAPGFIVRGRGSNSSINSAAHGAGRLMSRSQALKSLSKKEWNTVLKKNNVIMLGGDLDEAPMAYKDIYEVMSRQSDLVDILGVFYPRIVRMADPDRRKWEKRPKGVGE